MNNRLSPVLVLMILLLVPAISFGLNERNIASSQEVISMLAGGRFEEIVPRFDSTMKKAAPPARLEAIWTSLTAQTGKFVEEIGDTDFVFKGYDIVVVTCKFEKSTIDIKVVFDENHMIAGLFFSPHGSDTSNGIRHMRH